MSLEDNSKGSFIIGRIQKMVNGDGRAMEKCKFSEVGPVIVTLIAGIITSCGTKASRLTCFPVIGMISLPFVILTAGLSPQVVHGFDVTLSWDSRTDETHDSYRVYYREIGDSYDHNYPI